MRKTFFHQRYDLITLVCGIILGAAGLIFEVRVRSGSGFAGWPLRWVSYTDVGPSQSYSWFSFGVDVLVVVLGIVGLCEILQRLLTRRFRQG
jgi:uncharacterized membrane protein